MVLRFKIVYNIYFMNMWCILPKLTKKKVFFEFKNFEIFSNFLKKSQNFKHPKNQKKSDFFENIIFSFCSQIFFEFDFFFVRYNVDVEFLSLSISEGFRAIWALLHGFRSRPLFIPHLKQPRNLSFVLWRFQRVLSTSNILSIGTNRKSLKIKSASI